MLASFFAATTIAVSLSDFDSFVTSILFDFSLAASLISSGNL